MNTTTRNTTTVMIVARALVGAVIAGVGTAAFVLSYTALSGLAIMAHIPVGLAGLLPVVVDGTIVMATIGWLVLADRPGRAYFRRVLIGGAGVSVVGNGIHASIAGALLPWWAAALVAAVAPVSLLVDTHGLAVLVRADHRTADPATPSEDVPEVMAVQPHQLELSSVARDGRPVVLAPLPDPTTRRVILANGGARWAD